MIESVVLTVTDMKCGGCETNITGKLEAINGVISVKASFKDKEVSVEYDDRKDQSGCTKRHHYWRGFYGKITAKLSKYSLGECYEYRRDFRGDTAFYLGNALCWLREFSGGCIGCR